MNVNSKLQQQQRNFNQRVKTQNSQIDLIRQQLILLKLEMEKVKGELNNNLNSGNNKD
jgi:hypothetical protein